ncbi:uncharacterized protein LOC116003882 [Ipomoea triloba]|uniref:uncharacterized protein LOC116003882 n=1 Tax=Ipomoea triloba TaxID=35885 RepID=UPI00125CFE9F|nr:uncharacterized protein LOC116003882 [Ipomoea triloba]
MDSERRRMGFGWAVRDASGVLLGMAMLTMEGLYSVKEVEAMGAREALSWLKAKGWQSVILETDAQVVTNAVRGGKNLTPFGAIIDDIRSYLNDLPYVHFQFVKRSGNMVAHTVAFHALHYSAGGFSECFTSSPRFLSAVMYSDFSH